MDKNTIINTCISIITIYLIYSNTKSIIFSDKSIFNKITGVVSSIFLIAIIFFIVSKYTKGELGFTILELNKLSSDNEILSLIENTANSFLSVTLLVLCAVLFIFACANNYSKFMLFITNGKSYSNLKSVPKLYIETSDPCKFSGNPFFQDTIENFSNNSQPYIYNNNDGECPPISFYNEKTGKYQGLKLCDFYYPSSYNTLLSTNNNFAILDIDNLRKNIFSPKKNGNGMRFVHFEVYSSGELGESDSFPIISTKSLYKDSMPLDFNKVMEYLSTNVFMSPYSENCILPFFIYLECKFNESDVNIYNKIALSIKNTIGEDKLISKKYGFNGRNGQSPVSNAEIKEAFGKIVLFTNRYPTYSVLDEYINLNIKDSTQCNYIEYDKEYFDYDTGLATSQTKTNIIEQCKDKFTIVVPKLIEDKVIDPFDDGSGEDKSELSTENLFNPSMDDCMSYGIQFTLINPFYNNIKYEKIDTKNIELLNYFKYYWNSILLKDVTLRSLDMTEATILQQKPYNKFNNIKKLVIIPGFAPTTKKSGFI